MNTPAPPEYVSAAEAARITGFSAYTLERLRSEQRGPRYRIVNGRTIRYAVADLREWMDSRVVDTQAR
ncbi:helix-turn-helix domain-containing protein [Rhodococcus sp. YH1]|uniref:helix-turn-helix domain-containing protein n=1 Tax=Rhodococcus sp. YH1 TaxID=89066 RepID=UPI001386981E|nr:hypothetical protein [Rhodococcus sp. YH1]NCL78919.1 hypothetical protein [Rhodococcus sp. YH1]